MTMGTSMQMGRRDTVNRFGLTPAVKDWYLSTGKCRSISRR